MYYRMLVFIACASAIGAQPPSIIVESATERAKSPQVGQQTFTMHDAMSAQESAEAERKSRECVQQSQTSEKFIMAAFSHNREAMERALKEGADVNAHAEKGGLTALMMQVEEPHYLPIAQFLLAQPAIDVHAQDDSGLTALHHAAYFGNIGAISLLVEKGASVTAWDHEKRTPRMRAAAAHQKAAEKLLEEFEFAPEYQKVPVTDQEKVALRIRQLEANGALHVAVEQHDLKGVQQALAKGADINTRVGNVYGATPLLLAAATPDSKLAAFLLQQPGIDVNAPDNDRITALHYAASRDNAKLIDLLMEKHANINAHNKFGETPLAIAALYNKVDALKKLIAHHAVIDMADSFGTTPLILAGMSQNLDLIIPLLDAGADAYRANTSGTSFATLALLHPHLRENESVRKALHLLPKDSSPTEDLLFSFDEEF